MHCRKLFNSLFLLFAAVAQISADSITFKDYLINEILQWKPDVVKASNDIKDEIIERKSFLDYYNAGVESYLANDWESCIENIERSIELFKDYYETLTFCHISCEFKRRVHKPWYKWDFEQRQFFEEFLIKTACIENCRRQQLKDIPKWFVLGLEFKSKFMKREHYNYLNICYYKRNNYQMAASTAYTALIGDVTNTLARQNLEFYMEKGNLVVKDLVDLQAKQFSLPYVKGLESYKQEKYISAIEHFENALITFIREVDQCRSFCDDGEQLKNNLPDYYMITANAYLFNLRCKLNCTMRTQVVRGLYYTDIMPSIYEHLQHSYFKTNDNLNAVKAALSFLLFSPHEEYMRENVEKYFKLPEITGKNLKARAEAEEFYYRNHYELKMLNKIDEKFNAI